ncbi:MAG: ABC transporter permease [Candidatus Levybacteria bacterium]|nr:ABC transporter permease [Candidatus Levybacteria bacterium]
MNVTVIDASKKPGFSLRKIWEVRELLYFFALRDIILRYRYTLLGILWILFQPVVLTFIFAGIFGSFSQQFSMKIPYIPFTFIGLLYWNYFVSSLQKSSTALLLNQSLVTKVPFPKIALPLSGIFVGFIDFFLAFVLFIVVSFFFHIPPTPLGILMIVPTLLICMFTTLGLGLLFSVLQVQYRDARNVLPFFTTVFFFLTPVFYTSKIVFPPTYRWIQYFFNPLTGAIEGIRGVWFGEPIHATLLLFSVVGSLTILFIGIVSFTKYEQKLVDTL